jgi:hypothetical protein
VFRCVSPNNQNAARSRPDGRAIDGRHLQVLKKSQRPLGAGTSLSPPPICTSSWPRLPDENCGLRRSKIRAFSPRRSDGFSAPGASGASAHSRASFVSAPLGVSCSTVAARGIYPGNWKTDMSSVPRGQRCHGPASLIPSCFMSAKSPRRHAGEKMP